MLLPEYFYHNVIAQTSTAALFLFLVYSSAKDIESKTIPIHLTLLCLPLTTINLVANQTLSGILLRLGITAGVFFLLCVISKLFGLGGGDIIVISLILLQHGISFAVFSMGIGCVLTTIAVLLRNLRKRGKPFVANEEFPLVPGITVAYTILLFAKELSIWHLIL